MRYKKLVLIGLSNDTKSVIDTLVTKNNTNISDVVLLPSDYDILDVNAVEKEILDYIKKVIMKLTLRSLSDKSKALFGEGLIMLLLITVKLIIIQNYQIKRLNK